MKARKCIVRREQVLLLVCFAACAWGCASTPSIAKKDLTQFDSAFDDSLIIAASVLPDATVGRHYEFKLPARGQPKPYVWGTVSGELPEGLELDADGTISGIPKSAATSSFVVKVKSQRHPDLDEYGWVPHVWSRMRWFKLVVQEPPVGKAVRRKP